MSDFEVAKNSSLFILKITAHIFRKFYDPGPSDLLS